MSNLKAKTIAETNPAPQPTYGFSLPYNFEPRPYQYPFLRYMDNERIKRKTAFLMCHRRGGKDLTAWNAMIKATQKRVGVYWHMLPQLNQAKNVIWNGKTKEGKSFMDFIPPQLISSKRDDEMIIKLTNGSIIKLCGADKVDSLVGANPIWITFSEFAIMKPSVFHYLSPILRENDGTAVFVTTPRGKNHAYEQFKSMAPSPDCFVQLLTVEDTKKPLIYEGEKLRDKDNKIIYVPVTTQEDLEHERSINNMPEELLRQEYYCDFEVALVGSYYSEATARIEREERIKLDLFNPKYPVYTAWDLGISDQMAIWFFQVYDNNAYFIEYNEFTGRTLQECCHIVTGNLEKLKTDFAWDDLMMQKAIQQFSHHKKYNFKQHFAPHDIAVRELTRGVSRLVIAKKEGGIDFRVLKRAGVQEGIDTVRKVLVKSEFDKDKTQLGFRALKEYHKQWDDKRLCFADNPYHDWSSNGADSMRYAAQAVVSNIDRSFLMYSTQAFADHKYNPLLKEKIDAAERRIKKICRMPTPHAETNYNPLDLKNH